MKTTLLAFLFVLFSINLSAQTDQMKAKHSVKNAIDLMKKSQFDKALELYDKAIAFDPENLIYVYEKAICFYKMREYDSAIAILEPLLQHKDAQENFFQMVGACYDFKGKKTESKNILKLGLQRFPKSGRMLMELGIVEVGLKNFDLARQYWENGVSLQPEFAGNYFHLSKFYYDNGNFAKCVYYGETYVNMATNEERGREASSMVFDAYNLARHTNTESKFNMLPNKEMLDGIGLDQTIADLYETAFKNAKIKLNNDEKLTLAQVIKIRKEFIKLWDNQEIKERYPSKLFEFQIEINTKGWFEAYSGLMLSEGAHTEFQDWVEKNYETFDSYMTWQQQNPFYQIMIDLDK